MALCENIYRRGGVYWWRRRLRFGVRSRSCYVQVSLGVRDPDCARKLGRLVGVEADRIAGLVSVEVLEPEKQKELLKRFIKDQVAAADAAAIRATTRQFYEDAPRCDVATLRKLERRLSAFFDIIAAGGVSARLEEEDRAHLVADGYSGEDIQEIANLIAEFAPAYAAFGPEASHEGKSKVGPTYEFFVGVLREIGATVSSEAVEFARRLWMRAQAVALADSSRRYGLRPRHVEELYKAVVDEDEPVTMTRPVEKRLQSVLNIASPIKGQADIPFAPIVLELPIATDGSAPFVDSSRKKIAENQISPAEIEKPDVAESEVNAAIGSETHFMEAWGEAYLAWRIKYKNPVDPKTARQVRQVCRLFAKLLLERGVVEGVKMSQGDVEALFGLFGEVAKSYGKSPRDEDRSIAQLKEIGAGKTAEERGLEPSTINRHLSHLGQVIRCIRLSGQSVDAKIDIEALHLPETTRDRDKRESLTVEDGKAFFALPPFTGCKGWNKKPSFEAGDEIYHRGLYFAPIGLHYTGARREEICGLGVKDAVIDAPVPFFRIRGNEIRRIKNLQSRRIIPIPPEMIRLNFLDYIAAIKELGYTELFPDLKSPTSSSPLGDRLYDEVIAGIEKAIPQDGKRTKVIHSIRTAFGANLKREKVDVETRADLLGHGGDSVTAEVYADPTELMIMLEAMDKIPNVTADLVPRPIQLVPWIEHKLACPFSHPSRQKKRKSV